MINMTVDVETKSGKTYRSFTGVDESDFAPNTPLVSMVRFANWYCVEEAQQDAESLL